MNNNAPHRKTDDPDVSLELFSNAHVQKKPPCPSSPSPRGIDTWGSCSLFSLPDANTQLIEPEELCHILTPASEELNRDEYLLPTNGVVDFDLFAKLDASMLFRQDENAENDLLSHAIVNQKELEDPFDHLLPDTIMPDNVEMPKDDVGLANAAPNVDAAESEQAEVKSSEATESGGMHEEDGKSAKKMTESVVAKEGLTEEELKRIRRVKNRASVEKCRTKQRLRMEALQSEMEALTSENKALRDLTNWMDESVGEMAVQVRRLNSAGKASQVVDGAKAQI